jgi:outer membrane autotransporter protein
MGGASVVTPYANLDHVHARLGGFTESGLDGANLTVEGSSSARTFGTAGAKWAVGIGSVVPEVNFAYRYRFGDSRSSFSAAFLGDSSSDFDVVSASQQRGSFLAGVSVGGRLGPVDLRIGYEGEFNGDVTSHSGNFKLVLPLGGKR